MVVLVLAEGQRLSRVGGDPTDPYTQLRTRVWQHRYFCKGPRSLSLNRISVYPPEESANSPGQASHGISSAVYSKPASIPSRRCS